MLPAKHPPSPPSSLFHSRESHLRLLRPDFGYPDGVVVVIKTELAASVSLVRFIYSA